VEAIHDEPLLQELAWEYTQQFHRQLILSAEVCAKKPDDIDLGMATFPEVVFMAQSLVRIFMSLTAFSMLKQSMLRKVSFLGKVRTLTKLEMEVKEQKCTLVVANNGEVQRVTAVACVQLARPDGRIWVQLGKFRDGVIFPTCALPGLKMQDGADVAEMLDMVRKGELCFMSSSMQMGRVEKSIDSKFSPTYGIYTKYIRHVQHASIEEDAANDSLSVLHGVQKSVSQRSVAFGKKLSTMSRIVATKTSCEELELFLNTDDNSTFLSCWMALDEFDFLKSTAGNSSLEKLVRMAMSPIRNSQQGFKEASMGLSHRLPRGNHLFHKGPSPSNLANIVEACLEDEDAAKRASKVETCIATVMDPDEDYEIVPTDAEATTNRAWTFRERL